jgi:anion-transporting  ArsA/GET3 family ATPase
MRPLGTLEGLRFLYVTGKGGVGKSTVAAGVAQYLAARGRRVLLVFEHQSLNPQRLLGRNVGLSPEALGPNLFACAIEPEAAMQEYARSVLKSARLTEALFHGKVARGFLHGIPGLSAWAFLGKAWYFAEPSLDGPALGAPRVDAVVVDGPATGDSTDMLRVPSVIRDVAPRGRLRRDADACYEMLRDPARTNVLVTTTLEELPVTETEGLVRTLRDDLALPLGPLVVNQVQEKLLSLADRARLIAGAQELLSTVGEEGNMDPISRVIALARRRARSEAQADLLRARLHALALPLWEIPLLEPEPQGSAGLEAVAAALALGPRGSYRPLDP